MTLIAVGSVKGAPGVTTTVLALAAVWPSTRGVVIAEVDPDGGVLAARRELGLEPGLVTLAAALRRGGGPAHDHTQVVGAGVRVIVTPPSAEQTRAALAVAGDRLWHALDALDEDVIADCGRLTTTSPVLPIARRAATTLVLARPWLEDVALLRERVPALRHHGVDPCLLLVGDDPYERDELATAVDAPVTAVLPIDPRSAAALGARSFGKPSSRAPLIRSARNISRGLLDPTGVPVEVRP